MHHIWPNSQALLLVGDGRCVGRHFTSGEGVSPCKIFRLIGKQSGHDFCQGKLELMSFKYTWCGKTVVTEYYLVIFFSISEDISHFERMYIILRKFPLVGQATKFVNSAITLYRVVFLFYFH